MKRFSFVLILTAVFLTASGGAVTQAFASSCAKGNYHDTGRQELFDRHFTDMDVNGDDSLDFEEFKNVFPSTEQKAFNRLDNDKNGTLNHDEWHQFKEMHKGMGKHHKKRYHPTTLPEPSKFNAHFPDMDNDNDDRVTLEEFKSYFSEASGHEDVFNAIDLDGKGDIDHDEWHEFKAAHGLKHID